jgi:hypothetical protein
MIEDTVVCDVPLEGISESVRELSKMLLLLGLDEPMGRRLVVEVGLSVRNELLVLVAQKVVRDGLVGVQEVDSVILLVIKSILALVGLVDNNTAELSISVEVLVAALRDLDLLADQLLQKFLRSLLIVEELLLKDRGSRVREGAESYSGLVVLESLGQIVNPDLLLLIQIQVTVLHDVSVVVSEQLKIDLTIGGLVHGNIGARVSVMAGGCRLLDLGHKLDALDLVDGRHALSLTSRAGGNLGRRLVALDVGLQEVHPLHASGIILSGKAPNTSRGLHGNVEGVALFSGLLDKQNTAHADLSGLDKSLVILEVYKSGFVLDRFQEAIPPSQITYSREVVRSGRIGRIS